jgi:hypothetical protein
MVASNYPQLEDFLAKSGNDEGDYNVVQQRSYSLTGFLNIQGMLEA